MVNYIRSEVIYWPLQKMIGLGALFCLLKDCAVLSEAV
jgi:hypothetical protein